MSAARPRTPEGDREESRREEILHTAFRLFVQQGYARTGMRQIAEEAGVSLGLISYHFRNKRDMAVELLERKLDSFMRTVHAYVDWDEDPILYSATLVKTTYSVLSSPRYRAFYVDTLREDIYFEVILRSGVDTYLKIWRKYRQDMPEAAARQYGVYGNVISASMERTLVLYGEETGIVEDSIPDGIFKSYMGMWHFCEDEAVLRECCRNSDTIVERIRAEHPELYQ